SCLPPLPPLHSFPTRRSSDLRSPSRTVAPAARATSGVPSELPESATITSSGGTVWRWSDSKSIGRYFASFQVGTMTEIRGDRRRSEEHTSELQSRFDLVCRLL